MEVEDLLKKNARNPELSLEHANLAVPPRLKANLEHDFRLGIPFAYLLEFSEFYGHKFFINRHVLIPRPETEQFVDVLVQNKKRYKKVLDVGVGSGVLLLSLLNSNVAEKGTGSDLSQEALKVARTNALRQRLLSRCDFVHSDRFEKINKTFDLIVSNPPYIKSSAHRHLVHDKVDEYEPGMALYLADAEYEKWFQEFFMGVMHSLEAGGTFMMEGHELELQNQGKELLNLGFEKVEVLQDYCGNNRFLMAQRNN